MIQPSSSEAADFVQLVAAMRAAQREYFAQRKKGKETAELLVTAKQIEKQIDNYLARFGLSMDDPQ